MRIRSILLAGTVLPLAFSFPALAQERNQAPILLAQADQAEECVVPQTREERRAAREQRRAARQGAAPTDGVIYCAPEGAEGEQPDATETPAAEAPEAEVETEADVEVETAPEAEEAAPAVEETEPADAPELEAAEESETQTEVETEAEAETESEPSILPQLGQDAEPESAPETAETEEETDEPSTETTTAPQQAAPPAATTATPAEETETEAETETAEPSAREQRRQERLLRRQQQLQGRQPTEAPAIGTAPAETTPTAPVQAAPAQTAPAETQAETAVVEEPGQATEETREERRRERLLRRQERQAERAEQPSAPGAAAPAAGASAESTVELQLEVQGQSREAEQVRELKEKLRAERQAARQAERALRRRPESGEGQVVERRGDQVIIRLGDQLILQPAVEVESDRLLYGAEDVEVVELPNGYTETTVFRANGSRIITVRNEYGEIVTRVRRTPNGREIVLIDNRQPEGPPPVVFFEQQLPPLVVQIPREEYIVEMDGASEDEITEALMAPPVEEVERPYTLQEVTRSERLRDKVRRVDLDTITFEFGSAVISPDQLDELDRVGEALEEILADNPEEVFLVEGHTDAVGSETANLLLSDRRAEAVAVALSQDFVIPPENLVTQGYGEEFLKVPTQAPERENRRVTLRRITPLLSQAQQ